MVALFTAKLSIDLFPLDISSMPVVIEKLIGNPLVEALASPGAMPLWQITMAVNAVITQLVYYLASHLSRPGYSTRRLMAVLPFSQFWQRLLALYTQITIIYILESSASSVRIPSVHFLPW